MNTEKRRIAVNVGAGFVPGINAVVKGAALAARELGWEVVGIRDGFEGLLFRDSYPDGGLVALNHELVESMDSAAGSILGTAVHNDPFHVRSVDADGLIQEVDSSDALLETLRAENVDAVISVVGTRGLSILYKLHRKGLKTVCVPRSIENDMAATMVSFGFNSALSFTIEMLDRAHEAARAARKIGVVEVQGAQAGWLALQAAIAVCADAVLIPEIPCDLRKLAEHLKQKVTAKRSYGLVVVAEGTKFVGSPQAQVQSRPEHSLKDSLSPLATGDNSAHVIQRSGAAAETVAHCLQQLTVHETYPLVLGPWVRGGPPTAVDRQLGLAYGAGAVRALNEGQNGVMVAFVPPELKFVPLAEAINKVRTVPADSMFFEIARSLGICLGAEGEKS